MRKLASFAHQEKERSIFFPEQFISFSSLSSCRCYAVLKKIGVNRISAVQASFHIVFEGLPLEKRCISVITVPIYAKFSGYFAVCRQQASRKNGTDLVIISRVLKHSRTFCKSQDDILNSGLSKKIRCLVHFIQNDCLKDCLNFMQI